MQDAMSYGVHGDSALLFAKSPEGSKHAWNALSSKLALFRSHRQSKVVFDEEDRKHPDDPTKEGT